LNPERNTAIQRLLHPKSIAVLGASDDPNKLSGRPIEMMKRLGYQGRLIPINPFRSEVQGLASYPDVRSVDGDIDVAMIMLPANKVIEAVRECADRGIPAAIVGASGFAESGEEGVLLQRNLSKAIAETGIRVLGPNCIGMLSLRDRAMPTFTSAADDVSELVAGPVAFVSQSGAFGSFIFSAAQHAHLGISHFLNTGNEVDLTVAELLGGLVELDDAKVLMAYFEGVTEGRELLEVAQRASELDKPLIVVKVGKSESGARAAQSHTASLAGEDAVFDGAVRQYGVIRCTGMENLLDTATVFANGRRAPGRRLTTLSISGGAGVLAADDASVNGLSVDSWDAEWQSKMAAVIPPFGSARNPVDLTAGALSDPDMLRRCLNIAVEHPGTDMIAVLLGNSGNAADQLVDSIEEAYNKTKLPFVVVWTGGSGRPRERIQKLGIPCYTDSGRAIAALGKLADYSEQSKLSDPKRPSDIDEQAARSLIAEARARGGNQLDEYRSSQLIAAYGVPCAPSAPAASLVAAVEVAKELGFPVAIKLLSSRIAHKSDIGGVKLNIGDTDAVESAVTELLKMANEHGDPDAKVLVQRMATATTELIVGLKNDPVFGPVVVVGFGGVLVEVLQDSRVGVAPMDTDSALRLLLSLRAKTLFDGVRGGAPLDIDAAADAVMRLSWMAHDFSEELAELDVNPLLLGAVGEGVVAVDALAILTQDASKQIYRKVD
jgi:acyl-CoA synthetase (NDP forming)